MKTVSSRDGTSVAFDPLGEGPPVILVGGALTSHASPKMVELAELLARRFTVVNYDRRARGGSGNTGPEGVERELEDLAALVDTLGGSASLCGWSSGAVLALRAAAHGLHIERLALYDPPFVVAAGDPVPPADFTTRLEQLLAADRRSAAVSYYMTAGMGVSVTVVTLLRLTPLWSELKDAAHRLPYEWGARAADEWVPVTAPTLVVAGEQSPAPMREAAAALARALPDAQHRLLPAEGDDAAIPALARVLEAFFAERTPKAAVPAAA